MFMGRVWSFKLDYRLPGQPVAVAVLVASSSFILSRKIELPSSSRLVESALEPSRCAVLKSAFVPAASIMRRVV